MHQKTMTKRLMTMLVAISVLIFTLPSFSAIVHAAGDSNMDGGGGGFGGAVDGYTWSSGRDGVRVTIVRSADRAVMAQSIDYSNNGNTDVLRYFGKTNKIGYLSGVALHAYTGGYNSYAPPIPLPIIISSTSGGTASMAAIRSYFTDSTVLHGISARTGFSYDLLTNGNYRLLIEPIAYAKIEGAMTAMTATEAALLNMATGNRLRSNMPSLSHQNLPLALFLQRMDLGLPKWTGATSGRQTDAQIIQYLGMGVVRFSNDSEDLPDPDAAPDPPVPEPAYNALYRPATWVYSTVMVRDTAGRDHTPDNPDTPETESPVTVTFSGGGVNVTKTVCIPAGQAQPVWVKWRTPDVPGYVTLNVTTSSGASAPDVVAKIAALEENPPPDPEARDRYDGFHVPAEYGSSSTSSNTWWEYYVTWHAGTPGGTTGGTWMSHYRNNSGGSADLSMGSPAPPGMYWQYDYLSGGTSTPGTPGYYDFHQRHYKAVLGGSMTVTADSRVPTAWDGGKAMRSGYGFGVGVSLSSYCVDGGGFSPSSEVTRGQAVVMYFPEFGYASGNAGAPYPFDTAFWRLLAPYTAAADDLPPYMGTGDFHFKKNPYSTYGERAHFTPVWYPDGRYTPHAVCIDCWSPGGMLQVTLEDTIGIYGSVFDDWHVAPGR